MAAAARASRRKFGPAFLAARLAQLLPEFPAVRLCVAFSGGADSTALLAGLAALQRPGLKVRALHVNHHLQPQARRWSAHCRRLARQLQVPLEVREVHVPRVRGQSPEAAARAARYAALGASLDAQELLLTAHHRDDQLETVLLQMLRGAGLAGLSAMPAVAPFAQGRLLRPLLDVPAAELRAWLRLQGLPWVEDPSNQDAGFDRNYLRLKILPLLLARWPAAAATVARGARHAAEAQRLLDEIARRDCSGAQVGPALSAKVLRRLTPERRRNALRYWIAQAGVLVPPARRLEELAGPLLAARADTQPFIEWGGVRVARSADVLRLERAVRKRARPAAAAGSWEWQWQAQARLRLPGGSLTLRAERRGPLDLDALGPRLTVRMRRGGERLRPVRGGVRRTLKGLLQEARVAVEERARLPLIFRGDTLVAVAGLYLDAEVQAGAATRHRGRLSYRAH